MAGAAEIGGQDVLDSVTGRHVARISRHTLGLSARELKAAAALMLGRAAEEARRVPAHGWLTIAAIRAARRYVGDLAAIVLDPAKWYY